jgi:hypothetical protein|tara:strand:- start:639 stop:866 length:228 start_codon:yes stop_codon:yes gene_type:complete
LRVADNSGSASDYKIIFVKVAEGNVGVAKGDIGSLAARWASSFRALVRPLKGALNLFGLQPTYIGNANPDKTSCF